jgi:outer membrane protein OmpA-like peptidoglycan-associated protein
MPDFRISDYKDTGFNSYRFIGADKKPESIEGHRYYIEYRLNTNTESLKLYVVGHTDNVGAIDVNMKLSKERADAVVNALIAKYGIPSVRLKSYGVASLAPVATNDSEEGRAQNRRVELVKQ